MKSRHFIPLICLGVVLMVGLWSAIAPLDRFTWWLEIIPAIIGIAVLAVTYRRFRLTELLYMLCALHAIILLVGGHYTYAEVPLFNWLRDEFGLARNYYDRLGHLAQGFIPALMMRELLLRHTLLKRGKWLFFIITFSCLGISALYEIIEWQVSIYTGTQADAFLGTQGDIWDTQSDMLMAGIGAMLAQLLLKGWHDRQLRPLQRRNY